jgi:hypothetical protein
MRLSDRSCVTAREFLQLLGLLNSAADQVPSGRLYMRPLQLLLLSQWHPHSDPLNRSVKVPGDLLEQVWNFWASELAGPTSPRNFDVHGRLPLWAWGICPRRACGLEEESRLSINILEMKAVIPGVQAFQSTLQGKCIALSFDNSTVIAYVRRQGGCIRTLCAV